MTEPESRGILTILVVEDEAIVRNLVMKVLVRENYRVLEADSAAEALAVSDTFEGTIDLLIADHTLKTMTGREVAERIRQSRPGLKVLQTSGQLREKLQQEGGLMPDAEFLGKPFLPKALTEKVTQLLGRLHNSGSA
jgi:CheY-like chemotaxis protein